MSIVEVEGSKPGGAGVITPLPDAPHYRSEAGAFFWRVQQDNYGNDVSLAQIEVLKSGVSKIHTFRVVHHTERGVDLQRATIYAKRGKFVKYRRHFQLSKRAYIAELAGVHRQFNGPIDSGASVPWDGVWREPTLEAWEAAFTLEILSDIRNDESKWSLKVVQNK